jgi:hypothetical protein
MPPRGFMMTAALDEQIEMQAARHCGLPFLEHDPEKWKPVFGQDHAQTKKLEHDPEKWKPVFGQDHAQNEESRP